MSDLVASLWITLIGMGLVFVGILLLWGLMEAVVRDKARFAGSEEEEGEAERLRLSLKRRCPRSDLALKKRAAAVAVAVALAMRKPAPEQRSRASACVARSGGQRLANRHPRQPAQSCHPYCPQDPRECAMKLLVKIDDQSYEVEVGDLNARPVLASIDGETFEIWPEEAQSAPVQAVPRSPAAVTAPAPAAAPPLPRRQPTAISPLLPLSPARSCRLPSKKAILSTLLRTICVLEAMKMKNIIRATRAARIAKILVKAGDRVTQGQALVEYAD